MPRGRPRKNTVRIDVTFRLDPKLDAEFLAWLQSLPKGQRPAMLKRLFYMGRDALAEVVDEDDREAEEAAENILGAWEF